MQHVKEQNWFAVGLDVIVVIVGIFLGMQVQQWYDQRQLKTEEVYFLQRLKYEIDENIERVSNFLEIRRARLENLRLDLDYISGIDVTWTEEQPWCDGITSSHIIIDFAPPLPALQELTATGKLYSLSNQNLRQQLASHIAQTNYLRGAVSRLFSKSTSMSEAFPELISGQYLNDDSLTPLDRTSYNCDVEKMRKSSNFINRIINNRSRFSTYIDLQEDYLERLQEIDNQLEAILSELEN